MYSLIYTAHDLAKGKIKTTDPQRIKQAKLMLHDLLMSFVFLLIGFLFYSDKKSLKEQDQMTQMLMKVGYKSMNDLDVFSGLFASVSATPAFVKILGDATTDFKQVMTGDKEFSKALKENFKLLELLPKT